MTNQEFLNSIRDLIGEGDVKNGLSQIRLLLRNSPNLDDALLQSARFNDLLTSIKEKVYANRGAETSELLAAKSANDLDEKTVTRLFQSERALMALNANDLTLSDALQKRLAILALAENGHLYKGSFLALGKRPQIMGVCQAATPSQFIIYRGIDRRHIFQIENIEGNLIQQFEQMMYFLRKSVPLGRSREYDEDIYEVPMKAIVEFVANAYIHRDYSDTSCSYIQVEMYDDRIEIKSPGHLPPDIDVQHINNTVLRNPTLAAVFHLFSYAEKAGTGINTAQRILEERGFPPAKIENADSPKMVRITLQRDFVPLNGKKDLMDSIEEVYSFSKLTKEARELLKLMAQLPSKPIHKSSIEDIAAIPNIDAVLSQLVLNDWLEFSDNNNTFKMHPVVRMIVKNKIA